MLGKVKTRFSNIWHGRHEIIFSCKQTESDNFQIVIVNTACSYQLCDKIYTQYRTIVVFDFGCIGCTYYCISSIYRCIYYWLGGSDVFISLMWFLLYLTGVLSEFCLAVILVTLLPHNYNIVSRYPHLTSPHLPPSPPPSPVGPTSIHIFIDNNITGVDTPADYSYGLTDRLEDRFLHNFT